MKAVPGGRLPRDGPGAEEAPRGGRRCQGRTRSPRLAVRKNLWGVSGKTTVPMSRPAITTPVSASVSRSCACVTVRPPDCLLDCPATHRPAGRA